MARVSNIKIIEEYLIPLSEAWRNEISWMIQVFLPLITLLAGYFFAKWSEKRARKLKVEELVNYVEEIKVFLVSDFSNFIGSALTDISKNTDPAASLAGVSGIQCPDFTAFEALDKAEFFTALRSSKADLNPVRFIRAVGMFKVTYHEYEDLMKKKNKLLVDLQKTWLECYKCKQGLPDFIDGGYSDVRDSVKSFHEVFQEVPTEIAFRRLMEIPDDILPPQHNVLGEVWRLLMQLKSDADRFKVELKGICNQMNANLEYLLEDSYLSGFIEASNRSVFQQAIERNNQTLAL